MNIHPHFVFLTGMWAGVLWVWFWFRFIGRRDAIEAQKRTERTLWYLDLIASPDRADRR